MIAKSPDAMHTFHINEENFISSFAVLAVNLHLRNGPKQSLITLSKSYPYAFEAQAAVAAMTYMELRSDLLGCMLSYSFSKDAAATLLKKYFAAHLLHNPATRTASASTGKLQITPKGTALVYAYYKTIGLTAEQMPEVVKSNFNTMDLFRFERSCTSNRVVYSKYLCQVLIRKMLGPQPSVWSSAAKPQPAVNLFKWDSAFGRHDFSYKAPQPTPAYKSMDSPFHHRYFSNPESDAYIHYYESHSGMRVYHNREFRDCGVVEYCFSGKAFAQWLCDCTTLYSGAEAAEVGQLMLDHGIIYPVSATHADAPFTNDRGAFYMLAESYQHLCDWDAQVAPTPFRQYEEANDKEMFKKLLSDPGMRHVFREHLEKERCSENIEAYFHLRKIQSVKKQISLLLKHYTAATDPDKKATLHAGLEKCIEECSAMARHAYLRYFSRESHCSLNIEFSLKHELDLVIASLRHGSPVPKTPDELVEFLKTPVMEKSMGFEMDASESRSDSKSDQGVDSVESGYMQTEELECRAEPRPMSENIRALDQVLRCFSKVAASIYRLMEVDSYPKFAQSREHRGVMETLTQW